MLRAAGYLLRIADAPPGAHATPDGSVDAAWSTVAASVANPGAAASRFSRRGRPAAGLGR
jgi:hypothetical protein